MPNGGNYAISFIYKIIDQYTPMANRISAATSKMRSRMDRIEKSSTRFAAKMGGIQSAAGGVAAAIGGRAMLNTFVDFEQSQKNLAAVVLDASEDALEKFEKRAKELGKTTKFTATEVTGGMTELARAGLDVNEVLAAIPGTLTLAAAANIDMTTAASLSAKGLRQMGYEVGQLGRVNDVLVLAQARTNTNVIEFGEAMKYSIPLGKSLNISLEENAAMLGMLADAGYTGSMGGVAYANMLKELAAPTKRQSRLYRQLGIDMKKVRPKGQGVDFKYLGTQFERLKMEGRDLVPIFERLYGARGMRAALVLADQGGVKFMRLAETFGLSGAAAEAARIQMMGLPGMILEAKSATEGLIIAFFKKGGLGGFFLRAFQGVRNMAKGMESASPAVLKIVGFLGLLLVTIAPLTVILGVVAASIGAISTVTGIALGPLGLIILGFGALVVGVVALLAYKEEVKKFFRDTAEKGGLFKKWLTKEQDPTGMAGLFDITVDRYERAIERAREAGRPEEIAKQARFGRGIFGKAVLEGALRREREPGREMVEAFTELGATLEEARRAQLVKLYGEIRIAAPPEQSLRVESAEIKTDVPGNVDFGINAAGF